MWKAAFHFDSKDCFLLLILGSYSCQVQQTDTDAIQAIFTNLLSQKAHN